MKRFCTILLFGSLSLSAAAEPIPFSADSAYATIEHLSVTIGPRPMGSRNEQEALRWARDRFVRLGADSAYIIPFTKIPDTQTSINTQSGIAVGIFKGETDTSIVIGGHIDSASPAVPGADDNASGTAVMLELARNWSSLPRHYTLVFAAFGGEEEGLLGSKHFIRQYAHIDSVALMFSLDMAGQDGKIMILSDLSDKQTPKWLVRDAFRIDRKQKIHRLSYWPHFTTFNMVGGGAGSDHIPFLRDSIPAIDFTAGFTKSPIHTPQDDIFLISKPMLAEYGKLIHNLLVHYQENGIPSTPIERYMLLPVFGFLLFIPHWAMTGFYIAALGFAGLTLIVLLQRRRKSNKTERGRFSGLKLAVVFLMILLTNQLGQFVIQVIKHVRYPWIVNVWPYIGFGALLTILGAWLAARIAHRWRFCKDDSYYAIRLLVLIGTAALVSGPISLRLAMYPALMLGLISLAFWVRRGFLKIILLVLAMIPPYLLILNESFPEIARTIPYIQFMADTQIKSYLIHTILQLILLLPVFPILLGLAYLNAALPGFRVVLKQLRKPVFGVFVLLVIVISGYILVRQSAYNTVWKPFLHINSTYDMQTRKSRIEVVGTEYFKGIRFVSDSLEKKFSAWTLRDTVARSFTADWIAVSGRESIHSGEKDTVSLFWELHSSQHWQEASLSVRPDTGRIDTAWSDLGMSFHDNHVKWQWLTDPPESINVQGNLVLEPGMRLIRKIEGKYGIAPVPMQIESGIMNVRYRTQVTFTDTVILPRKSP